MVSNQVILALFIKHLLDSRDLFQRRTIVVLERASTDNLNLLSKQLNAPFIPAKHCADRADRITDILGTESNLLVHETQSRIDIGLLAALAGTIRAGGILVLGIPFKLVDQQQQDSAQVQRSSRYNHRFARLLLTLQSDFADNIVTGTCEVCTSSDQLMFSHAGTDDVSEVEHGVAEVLQTDLPSNARLEQDALLVEAKTFLETHTAAAICITGRRGRGKTTLMARLVEWLERSNIGYAFTAANRQALHILERHGRDQSRFISADKAHGSGQQVLLVDEAASLPLDRLLLYPKTHAQVIYGTTVEGYESTGRAFELTFSTQLAQSGLPILNLRPSHAWRWPEGDPLEIFLDQLLSTTKPLQSSQSEKSGEVSTIQRVIRQLDRDQLALDETMLHAVYGLLRDTHYQTSALDLGHMLDGDNLQIWVLEENNELKAALLLGIEGTIDCHLHDAIVSKQRRCLLYTSPSPRDS